MVYIGSSPDLVGSETLKKINDKLSIDVSPKEIHKIENELDNFYEKYIGPNMLLIIVIIVSVLYFIIQYYTCKKQDEIEEKYNDKQKIIINNDNQNMSEIISADLIPDEYNLTETDSDNYEVETQDQYYKFDISSEYSI
jgi:hypothetical protein